jgi:hypothetical protein
MVRIGLAVLLLLPGGFAFATPVLAQEESVPAREVGLLLGPPHGAALPAALVIPDSIRQRVGYQHWKGAAIGGGLGALAGLALALAAHGQCSDCSSDSPQVGTVTLAGAGLGGALGFLVGLASPRYRWVGGGPE